MRLGQHQRPQRRPRRQSFRHQPRLAGRDCGNLTRVGILNSMLELAVSKERYCLSCTRTLLVQVIRFSDHKEELHFSQNLPWLPLRLYKRILAIMHSK